MVLWEVCIAAVVVLAGLVAWGNPVLREGIAKARLRIALCCFLNRPPWHLFRQVSLPGTSVRIDYVVISTCGMFVITLHYRPGSVEGNPEEAMWSQTLGRKRRVPLLNPLQHNRQQIRLLARSLDMPETMFTPLVVFLGRTWFTSPMPACVTLAGRAVSAIQQYREQVFSQETVERTVAMLKRERSGEDTFSLQTDSTATSA